MDEVIELLEKIRKHYNINEENLKKQIRTLEFFYFNLNDKEYQVIISCRETKVLMSIVSECFEINNPNNISRLFIINSVIKPVYSFDHDYFLNIIKILDELITEKRIDDIKVYLRLNKKIRDNYMLFEPIDIFSQPKLSFNFNLVEPLLTNVNNPKFTIEMLNKLKEEVEKQNIEVKKLKEKYEKTVEKFEETSKLAQKTFEKRNEIIEKIKNR